MDGDDNDPTQATQNILDPRRVGKQNSGFSDEVISDIICVLYPHSDAAREAVQRLAGDHSPHIIGKDQADGVEPDYDNEDHPSRFPLQANGGTGDGSFAIILRLSSPVKHPAMGFAFGRNASKCDVVFQNDPLKRVSNVHFRIYVNEFGNVMIEDHSTNGTRLDQHLLLSNPLQQPDVKSSTSKWVLSSGSIIGIFLHHEQWDLKFQVRIPRRDDFYDRAYLQNVADFYARHGIRGPIETVGPGPGGHVDLFRAVNPAGRGGDTPERTPTPAAAAAAVARPSSRRGPPPQHGGAVKREWSGSEKYNKVRMIGKGAFAVVYKVTSKYDGRPYAAKELDKRRFVKDGVLDAKAENEMRIMKRVQHPNIVQYIEHIEWDERLLIIIMEFVPCGDLGKHIADEGIFPERTAKQVSQQLLSALGYLHDQQITHRDIKPDNILINRTEPLEVKLTDFGLSKMIDKEQTFLRTFCGTLLYCAPEVYTEFVEYDDNGHRNRGKRARRAPGPRYSHAVDIWSLGGVLFYTLTGAPPYPVKTGISYSELLHQIMTKPLNVQPLHKESVSLRGIDFLFRMLERRPEVRATVQELSNHSWLSASASTIKASESFDEVSDEDEDREEDKEDEGDEDYDDDHVQFPPSQDLGDLRDFDEIEDDHVSVSDADEESQMQRELMRQLEQSEALHPKGHNHHGPGPRPLKLFGEIGGSNAGATGHVSEELLNLQTPRESWGLSESHASEQTFAPAATQTRRRQGSAQTRASVANQSTDQLQSLVDDVASQSLGDSEPPAGHRGSSIYSTAALDLHASKRKPPSSQEEGDDFGAAAPLEKPIIKRLKSDANLDDDVVSSDMMEEYRLLARMPQVQRRSDRRVDQPVNKATYWEQDPSTWHLNYPEMTQLQQDAFVQAARDAGEEFAPGRTALWALAMKYFPAMSTAERRRQGTPGQGTSILATALRGDDANTAATTNEETTHDTPVTARSASSGPASETPTLSSDNRLQQDPGPEPLAVIRSEADSCVRGISVSMADNLVSFGRGSENTQIFEPITEGKIPKSAFKVLLWKPGFEPERKSSRGFPWERGAADPASYYCWISTKATLGIWINGQLLRPSPTPASSTSSSSTTERSTSGSSSLGHWTRLYDGDVLTIWNGGPGNQTSLLFRCVWGGSARPRPRPTHSSETEADADAELEMASGVVAAQLDEKCAKTERRIERHKRGREALAEYVERGRYAEAERARSRAFEGRREEAVRFLGGRRGTPAGVGARLLGTG